ncbi:M3 family oligoendopeptidase [Campylobacter hyointestinalis]|uniref:M3 family oligoendopeptidase n=1 Tax=Campylobacter hyointestinalis TaxID=198 RepID=UPI002552278B|nr:M3 family oligoendopeptidase [Campylobacter hyointestinalis]MDL2346685.1 M3 family oligoendopeptidase [Campylobacter hyointestinalis]MDL2348704.1 M3 family oligoendopeptidase [Campylobacter hyointestinalis]MDL2350171.1 M3 family oligoendopeptidase [Campylobacter hyointestinalis]MDM1026280.1 M3 family oligoendopeptidase [Campylobacter hyointestinalis]MDM1027455.1 M3 family oligoendopeptidase [Campylobacter hyointestinalis]
MMTWDLTIFFKNLDELDKFSKITEEKALKFNQTYNSNLNNLNPDDFLLAIKEYEDIACNLNKIMSYAQLSFAKDTSKGALLAKYEEICTKIEEKMLFFMLEFNQISKEKQDIFIEFCKPYSYYLELSLKNKPHQLSLAEERILLRTSNTGADAFSRLFDESMAKLKFKFEDKELSEEEILSRMFDKDREIRKKAALSLSDTLGKNQHLLTFIYNMIKTDLKNECELRNYEFPETPRHQSNQIDKLSVDSLIKVTEENFDLVSKFYNKKREILGYEKLYDYDRYAPLDDDAKFDFKEAKDIVLKAFTDFSPTFGNLAQKAFDENWCDVYPVQNKQSGAFSCSSSADTHPFVLLNYTDKRRDVFTLAHELGHAIHQYLSYQVGLLNSDTPLTTAETASVFCEMLVFEYIKNKTPQNKRIGLLAGKLEDIFSTLYRQINFTTFERKVHAYEGEISSDELNRIWLEESKKMFGDSLVLNDYYKIWWSYIPHFIHSPFYCYAYGYAQLLVLALFGLYKSGKCEDFVRIYTEFLSLGGSKSPKDMVAMFGFDINKEEFWDIGMNEIKKLVDEFIVI